MGEFFDMGGYGTFIWPGYAIVLLVLVVLALQSRKWLKGLEEAVEVLDPEAERPDRREADQT